MTLGELIEQLEAADQGVVCKLGFKRPHSYRGFYEQLGFEPAENVKVSDMLAVAKEAVGKTYEGWKGGDYTMDKHTDVWLSHVGSSGDALSPLAVAFMIGGGDPPKVKCYRCDGSGRVSITVNQ